MNQTNLCLKNLLTLPTRFGVFSLFQLDCLQNELLNRKPLDAQEANRELQMRLST